MSANKINYRSASNKDIDFIYQALRDMTIEENILDRFSQTKESLFMALFSNEKISEIKKM